MTSETHSADGSCRVEGERGAWRVVWNGYTYAPKDGPYKTREDARRAIRALKKRDIAPVAVKKNFDPVKVCDAAVAIRDQCIAHMAEIKNDPEGIYDGMDPGDGEVTLDGNGWNVLTVLNLLDVLGIPGCRT